MQTDAMELPGEVSGIAGIEIAILMLLVCLVVFLVVSLPSFALILWCRWRSRPLRRSMTRILRDSRGPSWPFCLYCYRGERVAGSSRERAAVIALHGWNPWTWRWLRDGLLR
jgi:hypothetical protein